MIRLIETKKGDYEVVNDIHGNAVAFSITNYEDSIQFDKPSESLTDSEIIARINAVTE